CARRGLNTAGRTARIPFDSW
nr:immunoglobulin heavy chain junction region [Macaca mulatta]MOV52960.1 immunoglobulin heavy chain junction region [Macaca mulatta]